MLKSLFKPGVYILGKLRYSKKFMVIGVAFLLPLLIIGVLLMQEKAGVVSFTANQRVGLVEIKQVRFAIELVQEHRGLSAAYLGGAENFVGRMKTLQGRVQQSLQHLSQLTLTEKGLDLPATWAQLVHNLKDLDQGKSFRQHTDLISDLFAMGDTIREKSGLSLDSSADTYYLISLITTSYPQIAEAMGQARGLASGIAARGAHQGDSRIALANRQDRISQYYKLIQFNLSQSVHHQPELKKELNQAKQEMQRVVSRYIELLHKEFRKPEKISVSAVQISETATEAIDEVYSEFDRMIPVVDGALAEREAAAAFVFHSTIGLLALVLLTMCYLFTSFYNGVNASISNLMQATEALAKGDLTYKAKRLGNDELTEVSESLNVMADQFRNIVKQVTGSAEQLAQASEELSAVTEESAQSVHKQKHETDQIASAMTEMSTTVREVAANAELAADAAMAAKDQAKDGNAILHQMTEQISGLANALSQSTEVVVALNANSNEIGSVLQVISDIAEQTNLLALNAAIEAARAGDSGRGFAVVADEVRSLAGRTQSSTEQIRDTIYRLQEGAKTAMQSMNKCHDSSAESVNLSHKTEASLKAIMVGVDSISDMGAQIASATEEQSTVSEEMSRNVEQISDVADQTSAASNQIAQASQSLSKLAQNLASQVAQFST
ncbi:methyl-accepting chemotaxis protein [Marinobacter salexigens]|uniref:Methyl-accepting chemotaxis protein n=1 Tax=Marinobacter salexigens TaxID=1925763 RepID=A0ABS6A934_9GAMM|nr:methyl-accepting chemotaxis protein [Marinobacter salexigens]MBU2874698.1 methyl-accepting chemotaxis protein [Marinobacter salexigens]